MKNQRLIQIFLVVLMPVIYSNLMSLLSDDFCLFFLFKTVLDELKRKGNMCEINTYIYINEILLAAFLYAQVHIIFRSYTN